MKSYLLDGFWRRIKSICRVNSVWSYENTSKICLHRRNEVAKRNFVISPRVLLISIIICCLLVLIYITSIILFYILMRIRTFLSKTHLKCGVFFTCRNQPVPKCYQQIATEQLRKTKDSLWYDYWNKGIMSTNSQLVFKCIIWIQVYNATLFHVDMSSGR